MDCDHRDDLGFTPNAERRLGKLSNASSCLSLCLVVGIFYSFRPVDTATESVKGIPTGVRSVHLEDKQLIFLLLIFKKQEEKSH